MDADKIRKTFIMKLLISPITLAPFFLGSLGSFVLAAGGDYIKAAFALGSSLVVSAGCCYTNALFRGEKILEKAKAEVADQERRQTEAELDELDKQLRADRDPRDEKMLWDLRALFRAIQEDSSWVSKFDSVTVAKLQQALAEVFDIQVRKLREALELKNKARDISNKKIHQSLLDEREKLLEEVQKGVIEFEGVFDELKGVSSKRAAGAADPNGCLARLRQTLEIGKKVRADLEERGLDGDFVR